MSILDHLTACETDSALPDAIPNGVAMRVGEWIGVYSCIIMLTPQLLPPHFNGEDTLFQIIFSQLFLFHFL